MLNPDLEKLLIEPGPQPPLPPTVAVQPEPLGYLDLTPTVVQKVRSATEAIQAGCDSIKQAWSDIGRRLNDVKDDLPHGKFELWLAEEFRFTDRQARNYMQVARFIDGLSKDDTEIISVLPETALLKLSAPTTSKAARDRIFDKARAGEKLRVIDVEEIILDAKPSSRKPAERSGATEPSADEPTAADAMDASENTQISASPAKTERPAPANAAPDQTLNNLLAELTKIIAPKEVQLKIGHIRSEHWERAEEALKDLVRITGDYSLLSLLSDVTRDEGGFRALIKLLGNFHEAHGAQDRVESDTEHEQLAA